MIQVDVQVFTPPVKQSFGSASIPLVIQTVSGSASKYIILTWIIDQIMYYY